MILLCITPAIKAILDTGCHLCNMSYGEDCGQANVGRWVELLRDELINKKQVVFVSSAGRPWEAAHVSSLCYKPSYIDKETLDLL